MKRATAFSIVAAGALGVAVVLTISVAVAAAPNVHLGDTVSTATSKPSPHVSFPEANVPTGLATAESGGVACAMAGIPGPGTVHHLVPGEALITEAEIRSCLELAPWAGQDPANDAICIQQGVIQVQCMADKGWWYSPIANSIYPAGDPSARLAIDGDTGGGDAYKWQDAGCVGLAVHETGMDNAN